MENINMRKCNSVLHVSLEVIISAWNGFWPNGRRTSNGKFNSCKKNKSGWGKLMFNFLFCFSSYCASEQGTFCIQLCIWAVGTERSPPLINKIKLIEQRCLRVATLSYLEHAGTGWPFLSNPQLWSSNLKNVFIKTDLRYAENLDFNPQFTS